MDRLFRDSRGGIAVTSLILLIPNTCSRDFTRGYIPWKRNSILRQIVFFLVRLKETHSEHIYRERP